MNVNKLTFVFVFILFIAGPQTAEAACELFAGALPAGKTCGPEVSLPWWTGTWAAREKDSNGAALTAFTDLRPDQTYKTSLVYDDGRRVEHSGTYKITYSELARFDSNETISSDFSIEISNIENGVKVAGQINSTAKQVRDDFAGALPLKPAQPCSCARGNLTYDILRWEPHDLAFKSPQTFTFSVQGDGYVRVSGPGVNNVLSRRYTKK